jgi:hypothetical protein
MAGMMIDYNTKYKVEAQLYGIGDPMGFIVYSKKDGSRLAELFIDEKTLRVNYSRLTPSVQASMVTKIRKMLPSIKYNYFN